MLLHQQVLFRQSLERRFVFFQIRTKKTQHLTRIYQILLKCTQDCFLGCGQQSSLPRKVSYDLT